MESFNRGEWVTDNLHIRLFKTERLVIDASWDARNVQSTYWRFYRNAAEGAAVALENGLLPLEAGRLYFLPAGVRFSCRNTRDIEHFYVHFDMIGLPGIAMRELFAAPIQLPIAPALESAVSEIAAELAPGKMVAMALQCRIKAVLYAGLGLYMQDVSPDRMERCGQLAAALRPVLPAIRQIEENCAKRLPVPLLAASCNMSENHFIRLFHERVGCTPAQYIQERRITLAAQRLLFTDESIEQIADTTGFGNRFYFSRIFARHTGVSPAAYRKASRV